MRFRHRVQSKNMIAIRSGHYHTTLLHTSPPSHHPEPRAASHQRLLVVVAIYQWPSQHNTPCQALGALGFTASTPAPTCITRDGAMPEAIGSRSPNERANVISRMITAFGRHPKTRPKGLKVSKNGTMTLANLMSHWGVHEGLTECDIMDAIKDHMFHEPGRKDLRFTLDNNEFGITVKVHAKGKRVALQGASRNEKRKKGDGDDWRPVQMFDEPAEGHALAGDAAGSKERTTSCPPWRKSRGTDRRDLDEKGTAQGDSCDTKTNQAEGEAKDAYQIGDKVRMRNREGEAWIEGTITDLHPVTARPDSWEETFMIGYRWTFVERKPVPPHGPPGHPWKKYSDGDFFWWYYKGPLGEWWCNDGEGQKVIPYRLQSQSSTPCL